MLLYLARFYCCVSSLVPRVISERKRLLCYTDYSNEREITRDAIVLGNEKWPQEEAMNQTLTKSSRFSDSAFWLSSWNHIDPPLSPRLNSMTICHSSQWNNNKLMTCSGQYGSEKSSSVCLRVPKIGNLYKENLAVHKLKPNECLSFWNYSNS